MNGHQHIVEPVTCTIRVVHVVGRYGGYALRVRQSSKIGNQNPILSM